MRKIEKIVIHCSASGFGDARLIDKWHRARGWQGIGYHFVVLNGNRSDFFYRGDDDGKVEPGRDLTHRGAHAKGYNHNSIGICLIGNRSFTQRQLFQDLPQLLRELLWKYGLNVGNVVGHNELTDKKTCPNLDLELYRAYLRTGANFPGELFR